MTYNINDIISLCLTHDVDFEIFHGDTRHKNEGSNVRAAMLIELSPALRIDFGDKRHGCLVSRIHVANSPLLKVTSEQLIESIEANTVDNVWHKQTATEELVDDAALASAFHYDKKSGLSHIRGTVSSEVEKSTVDNELKLSFDVTVKQFVLNTITKSVHELNPVVIRVIAGKEFYGSEDDLDQILEKLKNEQELNFGGTYIYPNILQIG